MSKYGQCCLLNVAECTPACGKALPDDVWQYWAEFEKYGKIMFNSMM